MPLITDMTIGKQWPCQTSGALVVSDRTYFVYILASRKHGTLYIGVTNDLIRRVHEHRQGLLPGFTRRYGVKRLVYYEAYQDVGEAIGREKAMKEWRRDWKIALIEPRVN